MLNKKCQK